MIKIAFVENQNLLREVIVNHMSQVKNLKVIFDTANEQDLVSLLRRKPVDMVVISPATSDNLTLDICKQALEGQPELKILLLTDMFSAATVAKAFQTGVNGFLNKNCSAEQLQNAIVQLYENGFYLEQEHLKHIKTSIPVAPILKSEICTRLESLTKRELEVLTQSALGKGINAIAVHFCMSIHTVKNHRAHILEKTGCNNITEAVVLALKYKMIKAKDIGLKCLLGAWLVLSMSLTFMDGIGLNEEDSDTEMMEICWGME